MSAPVPVPDPTATLPPSPPAAVHEYNPVTTITTAAAVVTNAAPAVAPPSQDPSAKRIAPVAPAPSSLPPGVPPSKPSGKSKKKKSQVTVTMATAPAAQSGLHGAAGENTGRWTAEEHRLFLQGLEQHGKGWKKIASLIKSRTVVQIRTHAQKYFQKLSKARQNGEEGEVSMEGRGGPTSLPSVTTSAAQSNKRRRQTSGTKRKAIQSVVASAQRQGKKIAAAEGESGVPNPVLPLPTVAPSLQPYVLPTSHSHPDALHTQPCIPSVATAQGSISGPALEDSLYVNRGVNICSFCVFHISLVRLLVFFSFRFLTPAPVAPAEPQVNEVARQAGANPITVPSDQNWYFSSGGDVSPTGVAEFALYPSWTDAKDTPSWYAKGSDVDALLDVADTLDWLTDTGDLHESYHPDNDAIESGHDMSEQASDKPVGGFSHALSVSNMSMNTLPRVDSTTGVVVPELPSLFDGAPDSDDVSRRLSVHRLAPCTSSATIDEHLQVFENHDDLEHDFVSSMLDNTGESSDHLADLQ